MPDLPTRTEPAASPTLNLSRRHGWSAVTALAVAVFAVTATEMLPIGLLPQIATDLHVSAGAAGLSVTLYGLVAGLLAPPMTSWTRRLDRRVVVLSILGVFIVGNIATALVWNYPQLLIIRVGIGVCHGLMWSIIASVAIRLVPTVSAAKATATVFSGISLALVLGVPAGAALGSWLGWHAAFTVLAAITALAWIAVLILVPALSPRNPRQSPQLGPLLRSKDGIRTALAITALVVVGNYAAYTYIAPYLIENLGVPTSSIGVYLLAYGIAGVIGNFVAGAAVTRVRSLRTVLSIGLVILTVSLAVLRLAPVGVVVAGVMIGVWGLSYSALPVILQTLIFRVAPTAREAATSLYVLVFNVSIAAGALVGAVGTTSGPNAPILLGALLCCAAACSTPLIGATPTDSVDDSSATSTRQKI